MQQSSQFKMWECLYVGNKQRHSSHLPYSVPVPSLPPHAFNLELRQLRPGKTKLLYKSIITVSRQLFPVSLSAQKHFSEPYWMHLVNGALKSSAFPMAMWQTQVTDERALMSFLLWEGHRMALLHRYGHESHGTMFPCVKVMKTGAAGSTVLLENQRQVPSQTNTLDQHCLNRWTWLYSFTSDHNPIRMLFNELSHGCDEKLSVDVKQ